MNKSFISSVAEQLLRESEPVDRENKVIYETINVRPGAKLSAMLDLFSELSETNATHLITEKISTALASYAVTDIDNIQPILEAIQKTEADGYSISASNPKPNVLDLLVKNKTLPSYEKFEIKFDPVPRNKSEP